MTTIDTRYPYTYAADLVRSGVTDWDSHMDARVPVISRSVASQARSTIAEALGMTDKQLAMKLADHYLAKEGLPLPDKCSCGERLASECEEEWGPKCDLGNNAAHARVVVDESELEDMARSAFESAMGFGVDLDAFRRPLRDLYKKLREK